MESNTISLNQPKVLHSWAMYDWANSVYSLTIVSAVFPAYFESVTNDIVNFAGFEFVNTTLYSYALSFSFLIISLLSPLLSGIADSRGNKKSFMKFFAYLGSIACAGMFFFNDNNLALGIWTSVLASIGFAGSLVFYNAFLPEIATPDRFDKLSARGFSLGYIGSVILLIMNLSLIMFGEKIGIDEAMASKISFLTVALWWAGFSQITFNGLPETDKVKPDTDYFRKGYKELRKTWSSVQQDSSIKKFLLSFFFYSMAVQTVMYLATLFGTSELKLETSNLILAILIIQIVAIGGAHVFSIISKAWGNTVSLKLSIAIWIGICLYTYALVVDATTFYIDAFLVGVVMGGIQSTSRATYAKLIPEECKDTASYFSLYEIFEKVGIVLGTFSFGLLIQLTGTMRNSVLALCIYFLIGLVILMLVKDKRLLGTRSN